MGGGRCRESKNHQCFENPRITPSSPLEATMKKLLVLTSALLVLGASVASAQINLAWRNCIAVTAGGTSAQQNVTPLCDGSQNGIPFKGVLSFIAPANTAQFVGCDALLD